MYFLLVGRGGGELEGVSINTAYAWLVCILSPITIGEIIITKLWLISQNFVNTPINNARKDNYLARLV